MIALSAERTPDGEPALAAVAVGEFEAPTAIHIDVLIYRETLAAGTYTLTHGENTWTVKLPEAATMQGFPGVIYNVQFDL